MNISNVSSYKNQLDFKLREQTQSQRYREVEKPNPSTTNQNDQYFNGRRYNIGKDTVTISQEGINALSKMKESSNNDLSNLISNNNGSTIEELKQRIRSQREAHLELIANEQGIPVKDLKSQIEDADPKKLKLMAEQFNLGIEQLIQFKGSSLWS